MALDTDSYTWVVNQTFQYKSWVVDPALPLYFVEQESPTAK